VNARPGRRRGGRRRRAGDWHTQHVHRALR
jgi:hypothetical protein